MKRLLAAILSAALMIAGTLVATANGASATDDEDPRYPGTINTNCAAFLVGKPHNRKLVHIHARVAAPSSPSPPEGVINVKARKFNGGDRDSDRFFTRDGSADFFLGPLKPGRYSGSMMFDHGQKPSLLESCGVGFSFKVSRVGPGLKAIYRCAEAIYDSVKLASNPEALKVRALIQLANGVLSGEAKKFIRGVMAAKGVKNKAKKFGKGLIKFAEKLLALDVVRDRCF